LAAILVGTYCVANAPTVAGDAARDFIAVGAPLQAAPADPAIARALAQISARRIEDSIETLVGFGTRHTLSSMVTDLPKGQGVNAAADWIESQLKRYSDACGGCLEVKRDAFTEGPEERVPAPTNMTNIYAVLRGSDPAQADRMVLVSGHYDSLMSDFIDGRSTAPGANDDASGVAVSLECARVLSTLKFPATIVFAAVVGEEQGLYGSRHLAKLAKSQGWQIEAVLNNDIVGGNTTPGDRGQDKSRVRVFSEGIPAAATPDQVRTIEAVGYES
jgi:acetylornithine deacetylase/succinyl-diaminopimelate desuccinylase-like protein